MSTVEKIKAAIEELSPRERAELNVLLHNWLDDDWDKEMARDAEARGKLDHVVVW